MAPRWDFLLPRLRCLRSLFWMRCRPQRPLKERPEHSGQSPDNGDNTNDPAPRATAERRQTRSRNSDVRKSKAKTFGMVIEDEDLSRSRGLGGGLAGPEGPPDDEDLSLRRRVFSSREGRPNDLGGKYPPRVVRAFSFHGLRYDWSGKRREDACVGFLGFAREAILIAPFGRAPVRNPRWPNQDESEKKRTETIAHRW
jgi:hypothetical protein